jgi:hypothetical protein
MQLWHSTTALLLLPAHIRARDVIWVGVQVVAAGGAATKQQLSNGQSCGSSNIISLGAAAAAAAADAAWSRQSCRLAYTTCLEQAAHHHGWRCSTTSRLQ